MKRLLAVAVILSGAPGCSNFKNQTELSASEGRLSPSYPGPPEMAACTRVTRFDSFVTARGLASYRRRVVWGNSTSGGLGGSQPGDVHPAESRPIRQAEVVVTDPSGAVVQCGATADDGSFAIDLPRGDVDYTLSIQTRALGAAVNASVLNRPELNQPYALRAVVNAQITPPLLTLTARADADVLGGAFNILDMIYEANRYLRAQIGSCSALVPGCRDVTFDRPLPKVTAYWERGFNPNSYFGGTSGLSFYLPGYARLFILGGEEGDVDSSDTDHFDNSVIIHEYGHFLEDTVGVSNSPGGAHNGNRVIDPRLAWSEGWGNFFQAAVRGEALYRDTTGNDDGVTALTFDVNLETGDNLTDETSFDVPEYDGEGNYREFSVTRLLWDVVDATPSEYVNGAFDTIAGRFIEIWSAFSATSNGYPNSAYNFRNVGLLHLIQKKNQSRGLASDWSNLRTIERQNGDESTYGQHVVPGACAPNFTAVGGAAYQFSLTPGYSPVDAGTLSTSHLFLNNRFYHLRVDTPGVYPITLEYEDANHVGPKATLSLFVYNAQARFGLSSDIVARQTQPNVNGAAAPETKTVQVALPPGDYLINVNVNTAGSLGGTVDYNLKLGSALLCPSNPGPL